MMKEFYTIFNLKSSNIDKSDDKDYYKFDILYGSIDQFEADALRDEFLHESTRSQRPYDIVIVDEADSMLIDGINHTVRLGSPMPGMINLLPLLISIWCELHRVEEEMPNQKNIASIVIDEVLNSMKQRLSKLNGGNSFAKYFPLAEHMREFVVTLTRQNIPVFWEKITSSETTI